MLALVIAYGGIVSSELRSGTGALTLAKPLSRSAFVFTKWLSQLLVIAVAGVAGTAICIGITGALLGSGPTAALAAGVGLWFAFAAFLLSAMVLLSVTLRAPAAASGAGVGIYIALTVIGQFELLSRSSPAGLMSAGIRLVLGQPTTWVTPLLTALAATACSWPSPSGCSAGARSDAPRAGRRSAPAEDPRRRSTRTVRPSPPTDTATSPYWSVRAQGTPARASRSSISVVGCPCLFGPTGITASRGASAPEQPGIETTGAAVVRHADHATGRQIEPLQGRPLDIAGEQHPLVAEFGEHHQGIVVLALVAAGPGQRSRGQHPQAPTLSAQRQRRLAAPHLGPGGGQLPSQALERRVGLRWPRQQRSLDRHAADHVLQPAGVVGVTVREHEQVDAPHGVFAQVSRQRTGSGIDEDRRPRRHLHQRGGALADVEEGHRRLGGRRRPPRREHEHDGDHRSAY